MKTKYILLAPGAGFVAIFLALWMVLGSEAALAEPAAGDASLNRKHAATIGKPDAKVHLVEFLDPACEACRAFYPQVKQIVAKNPERIRLSVRLLGFHQGADFAVKALSAAKLQGKFWPALEQLLASQDRWAINHRVQPELVWEQLTAPPLGLDLERLKVDMESFDVARSVALDLQDAKSLKVAKTPEFFVNGRVLPQNSLEQLQRLLDEELAKAN